MSRRIVVTVLVAILAPAAPLAAAEEGTPDLQGGFWFAGDADPDAPFTLDGYLINWETTDVGAFTWRILIDDEVAHEETHPGLIAFESVDLVGIGPISLPAGWHTFRMEIDPEDEIAETDEANNDQTLTVLVSADHPDVRAEIVEVRAAGGLDNVVEVDWRICNDGTLSTLSGVFVQSSLTPQQGLVQTHFSPFGTAQLGPIDAGACVEGTFARATGDNVGDHALRLSAFHWVGGAALERGADRADNAATDTVTLVPLVGQL